MPTDLKPTPTGTVNILIVGKDARAIGPVLNEGRQRNKREERSHSDIIIVCHVNFGVPAVNLVAIPRDLLVEVPGITAAASNTDFTRMEKIAHVYAIGGDKLLRRTLTHLLGIPIHRSIAFDFDTFRMAFDVLRPFIGILRIGEVNLTERDQALKFARKRYGLQWRAGPFSLRRRVVRRVRHLCRPERRRPKTSGKRRTARIGQGRVHISSSVQSRPRQPLHRPHPQASSFSAVSSYRRWLSGNWSRSA